MDPSASSSILLNHVKYLQEAENVYDHELDFFDLASIFKHTANIFEDLNDTTNAKEFETKSHCVLNHSRIC